MSVMKSTHVIGTREPSAARRRLAATLADFAGSAFRWRLAWSLAREDLFSTLHLSKLGPLWLIIQPLLWMLAMIALLRPTQVAQQPTYALYVALGVILYHGIQTFVTRGAQVFTREKGHILNIPLPLSIFVLKNAMLVVMEMAIASPIALVTIIVVGSPIGPAMLLAIPGMVIFLAFGIGVTLLLGTLAARIVDIVQAVQSAMRVLLFLTPVFWQPEGMGGIRHVFAYYNPLYYALLVVRAPLMGYSPEPWQWLVALGCAVVSLAAGVTVFARFRERIPVWI
jgi:ABC-type polysaccharide/polyol phosphate export permease